MIIKKTNFNLAGRKYRGNWPFNVDQVAVMKMKVGESVEVDKLDCFGIIHNFGAFALSGVLENYGFAKLETAGIWADNPEIPGTCFCIVLYFGDWKMKIVKIDCCDDCPFIDYVDSTKTEWFCSKLSQKFVGNQDLSDIKNIGEILDNCPLEDYK